ncbi:hypothetical protein ACLOJK_026184 [Asimina triloba]
MNAFFVGNINPLLQGNTHIDCNDSGADFVEARMYCELSDFHRSPYFEIAAPFAPCDPTTNSAGGRRQHVESAPAFRCNSQISTREPPVVEARGWLPVPRRPSGEEIRVRCVKDRSSEKQSRRRRYEEKGLLPNSRGSGIGAYLAAHDAGTGASSETEEDLDHVSGSQSASEDGDAIAKPFICGDDEDMQRLLEAKRRDAIRKVDHDLIKRLQGGDGAQEYLGGLKAFA